jgi:hypothetical protein
VPPCCHGVAAFAGRESTTLAYADQAYLMWREYATRVKEAHTGAHCTMAYGGRAIAMSRRADWVSRPSTLTEVDNGLSKE